jgi:dynein heavy chain
VRALRAEKIMHSFSHYVAECMGEFYDTIPSSSMLQVFTDSKPTTPIIFILSTGADPTGLLLKFAREQAREV